jgi:LacI family transcriptional regulator
MAQPTMRDVAFRAGVGVGTVSRVVNGGALVRPTTAERVLAAIAELGYRPNEIARALRPGKTAATIALLLGDLTNPFYAAIAKSAVEIARSAGYAVVVTMVDEDPSAEEQAVRDLLARHVAGLILVPDRSDHAFVREPLERGVPVVFVDRPASGSEADVVVLDNERGGYLAADHLAAQGHRRIAALVAPSYYTTGRRVRGFRRALRDRGIEWEPGLTVALPVGTAEAAFAATRQLVDSPDPPTALFATTNFVCEGALRAVRAVRRPPAVVGFDDFRFADLLPTPATVVAGDPAELGRRATELLLQRVSGDRDGAPERVVLPVRLIPRGSGEKRPW